MLSPIQRSSSPSSVSSSTSSAVASLPSQLYPSRRRVSLQQRQALQKMFDTKTHPTKEERVALSSEIGMDLKALTVWFQNKRQTTKRQAFSPPNVVLPHSQSQNQAATTSSKLRPTISLDHIAELSERPMGPTIHPLTPRINASRKRSACNNDDVSELLMHMPSSPLAPPSSPSADSARLSVLPLRSKTMRSLEWACAKARTGSQHDKENFPADVPTFGDDSMGAVDDYDTDTETDEAVTPDASISFSPMMPLSASSLGIELAKENVDDEMNRPFEDVDAAMVLLGFMGQQ